MKTISMLELRQNARAIIQQVRRGERLVLTYRGVPMARIEPIDDTPPEDDPFYRLPDLALDAGESLSNQEMDEAVYGA